MKTTLKRGFTLVEIIIVVVIAVLLAAMAIPAFKKVRVSSIAKTTVHDGRQIGAAAQKYFVEKGASSIAISSLADGSLEGPLSEYISQISPQLTIIGSPIDIDETGTVSSFTLQHDIGSISFNNEGKAVKFSGQFIGNTGGL